MKLTHHESRQGCQVLIGEQEECPGEIVVTLCGNREEGTWIDSVRSTCGHDTAPENWEENVLEWGIRDESGQEQSARYERWRD